MKVAVPAEVKDNEFRVALTPGGVRELVAHGHDVTVEQGAGLGSAFGDDEYKEAGARILADADDVWGDADMVVKVKEPVAAEYHRLREDLTDGVDSKRLPEGERMISLCCSPHDRHPPECLGCCHS